MRIWYCMECSRPIVRGQELSDGDRCPCGCTKLGTQPRLHTTQLKLTEADRVFLRVQGIDPDIIVHDTYVQDFSEDDGS